MEFSNVAEAIGTYVQKRDELRAWAKARDEEEAIQKKVLTEIEVWLLMKADELGLDALKSKYGTAYKTYSERYRIANWEEFVSFVKETDNFSLFEKRVAKLAAKEVQATTGEVPKGLEYSKEAVVNVRRPTKGD